MQKLILSLAALLAAALALTGPADAQAIVNGGKLLLTDGVSTVEGSAGGGLATWAVIAGGATADGVGVRANVTGLRTGDYQLWTGGISAGVFDRVEISYARQAFDTRAVGSALGLGKGFTFHQDVYGVKVRLIGDLVYDQDRWTPQISVGVQYKKNDRGAVVRFVGADRDDDFEPYISATKLFLAQGVLISGTVRATRANQFGILGFGGPQGHDRSAQFEGSAAWLVSKRIVLGVEGRTKPDNLAFAKEEAAYDVFAALAVNKRLSLTAAYVNLGSIGGLQDQSGAYLSLRAGF